MSKKSGAYPVEFRNQMVELVRAGRSAVALAREFGCHSTSISAWVRQAQIDEVGAGRSDAPLTSQERQECWCALNFDQALIDVDYYTAVDKSTKLTGS